MTEIQRETSRGALAGRWLLALAVSGAALAAGTVHTVVLCVVAAVLLAALICTWWNADETRFGPRRSATLLLGAGAVLTAYTVLQCVPMPIGWLSAIAPHNADVWSRALSPLHEPGPAWAPISLDPPATRIEVLKGVSYLLAFVTALRIAGSRSGVGFLSTTIIVTGAALAVMALLHPAFGARKLYGVFEPSAAALAYDRHVAPFLNPNNLAAYLNVAFCLALAASMAPEPRLPRPIAAAIGLFLATTQVWVASRGGVATMALGAVLVVIMMRAPRAKRQKPVVGEALVAGFALAAGAFAIVLSSSYDASSELLDTDKSKFVLIGQALRMLPAFPVLGAGRGAFESAFPAFRQSPGVWTFTHPECVIVQWVVEWGVPLGLAGLACIAIGLRPTTVLARSSTSAGAWAAITVVAVQNLVDLGSEIPGLMLAPVVCAAIVVGGTAGREARWRLESWSQVPRALVAVCAGVTTIALASALWSVNTELRDDRSALYEDAVVDRTPPARMHTLAREAMLRHPAEPYLPFIVSWRAAASGDDDPVVWLEATLERANVYAPAHLVLARLLAKRSRAQARLEYRLATEQGLPVPYNFAPELARLVAGYYDAMELVPEGEAGLVTLRVLVGDLQARLPATCARLDHEIASRAPSDAGPALRAATGALQDLQAGDGAPWCVGVARRRCVQEALEAAQRARRLQPATCEPYLLQARVRVADGDTSRGLAELAEGANLASDHVQCLQALAGLAEEVHDERRETEALTRIIASGCAADEECAVNLAWVADKEEHRGNARSALAFYRKAYDRFPRDTFLESVARLAASTGMHTEAADGYERLARKHPDEARWQRAAATEREAALGGAAAPL
jgi:hypothetical protein